MVNQRTFNGRLPGVICETGLLNQASNPLRMDITGFVGFAERGPVDVPVRIEDINQFRLIFGGDFAIALNDGAPVRAFLYPVVQAFFENGGRVCYVVRVTGAAATRSRIILPGLLQQGGWQAVDVSAAWVGRWSHTLQIGTALRVTPLKVPEDDLVISRSSLAAPDFTLPIRMNQQGMLRSGDVLRLLVREDTGDSTTGQHYTLYMTVSTVTPLNTMSITVPSDAQNGMPVAVAPDRSGITVFRTDFDVAPIAGVEQFGADGWQNLLFAEADMDWQRDEDGRYSLILPIDNNVDINEGDMLRLTTASTGRTIFMTVQNQRRDVIDAAPDTLFLILETVTPLQEETALPDGMTCSVEQVDLLAFDMVVQEGNSVLETWDNLRFSEGTSYWQSVLMPPIDPAQVSPLSFNVDDFTSFSLRAGRDAVTTAPILPVGMDGVYRYHGVQRAGVGSDDLDVFIPQTLFRDAAFDFVTTYNTMQTVSDVMYLAPQPRRLRGMHALLPVSDVALIAVPDAVHVEWEQVDQPEFHRPAPDDTPDDSPSGFHDCPPDDADTPPDTNGTMPVIELELAEVVLETRYAHLPTQLVPTLYNRQPLLLVQQSLVRLCAARADCVAVFSLPKHYEQRWSIDRWYDDLTQFFAGTTDLSYATVYHGWVGIRETTTPMLNPVRYIPADGTICGMIVEREIRRGVWIAPANIPLRNVVQVQPNFDEAEWAHLYNRQLNIIRRLPGRYALRSATTLSPDSTTEQLSVRRLMIFLRKVALREGQRYVFETNNERFRALVQTYFERILTEIMDRGGITAFQIVTGAEINTPNDIDNGRFLIAIKFAPSLPVEFITLVLLRSGDDGIDILER